MTSQGYGEDGNPILRTKQSGNSLQPLLDVLSEPVLITGWDGQVVMVNSAAARAFAYERDDLLATTVQQLIGGINGEVLNQIIEEIKQGRRLLLEGASCSRADHTTFAIRITVGAVITEAKNRICFCLHNITADEDVARLQAQVVELTARAESSEKRQSFIAETVYQLSQPLQTLMSTAEADGYEPYKREMYRLAQLMQALWPQVDMGARAQAAPAGGGADAAFRALTPTEPNRVLVADDEKPLREIFQRTILAGFPDLEIDLAPDGRQAVEMFKQRHHAIILLDLLMPVVNGEEAFAEISEFCEQAKWQMPSVLFCSGFALPEPVRDRLKEDRIHRVVQKPVNRAVLIEAVEQCLVFHRPGGQAAEALAQPDAGSTWGNIRMRPVNTKRLQPLRRSGSQ